MVCGSVIARCSGLHRTDHGYELLTEGQDRELQKLGDFDTKTSRWVKTPLEIRELGSAVFCDRRYGHVFLYHNGAKSCYAARGAWLAEGPRVAVFAVPGRFG